MKLQSVLVSLGSVFVGTIRPHKAHTLLKAAVSILNRRTPPRAFALFGVVSPCDGREVILRRHDVCCITATDRRSQSQAQMQMQMINLDEGALELLPLLGIPRGRKGKSCTQERLDAGRLWAVSEDMQGELILYPLCHSYR